MDSDVKQTRSERFKLLSQTARGTLMGTLLRKFWHPVALTEDVAPGKAKPIRIMGEELTLYRGTGGQPHLVGGRCAHRRSALYTGWVEGDEIRCLYHGWKYSAAGDCVERPAEKDSGMPRCKIAGYPVREYCGLIFAYLGDGPEPEFDLPRKDALERPGATVVARGEKWPCNWFQMIENSMDPTHVSFVHQKGAVGALVTGAPPVITDMETEAGIEVTATRANNNIRKCDWTFPNNNHTETPGFAKGDPWIELSLWNVPHDDESTTRYFVFSTVASGEAQARFQNYFEGMRGYNPANHHDELMLEGKYPDDQFFKLINAQDYVALVGQGTIADRNNETLGASDRSVLTLRRIFLRELEAIEAQRPTKAWHKLSHAPANMQTRPEEMEKV